MQRWCTRTKAWLRWQWWVRLGGCRCWANPRPPAGTAMDLDPSGRMPPPVRVSGTTDDAWARSAAPQMGYQPMHSCGGGVGEIELQIGSPRLLRSDGFGRPPADAAEPSGSSTGGLHNHQSQQHLSFRLFKRSCSGGGSVDIGLGLGIREWRKLGNVLFLAFCGVYLVLAVNKIWAGGWFAAPAMTESDLEDLSTSSSDKGHSVDRHLEYMGGK